MVLIVLSVMPVLCAQAASRDTSVSGVVRDAKGVPQMGALVQLLSKDSVVLDQAYTNLHGGFVFRNLFPGTYQMKATCASFLPTLRENLKVRGNRTNIVNLTLNTLFEAIQWLPAEPRSPGEPSDDWKWTLRSANNRPLLRFLENGPLVVVRGDKSQPAPQLEARVVLSSASREFGNSAPQGAFEIERTGAAGQHVILSANVAPQPSGQSRFVAGFEQPLGLGRTIRSVASYQQIGGIEGAGGSGSIQTLTLRGSESLRLSPNLSAEFGSQLQSVRGPSTLLSNSPFAVISWQSGSSRISYTVSTSPMVQSAGHIADHESFAPQFSEVNGSLQVQHGLHQELRIEDYQAKLRALIDFYHDEVENPIVGGGGLPSAQDFAGGNLMYDPMSRTLRVSGPSYSSTGFTLAAERQFGDSTWASFSYSQGTALSSAIPDSAITASEAVKALKAQQAEAFTGRISGKLPRTGTLIRASYRWQPEGTVTPVALYDNATPDAYLSLLIRQPIRCGRILPNGTEALVAVRNLLAEGYRPFLTPDGSRLYFARADRAFMGGLSFNF